jgi:hypothetical protein
MKNEDYRIIARHTLEVRLKNKIFSFLDFKGKMIDSLVKETGYENIRFENNGSRIDLVSDDFSEAFFFSISNFGFQIEGAENFEVFKVKVNKFFSLLNNFSEYDFSSIIRIGTRSSILCHKKNKNYDVVKQTYKDLMFKDYAKIEKKMGSRVLDLGYILSDMEKDGGKLHITTGPMTKDEAIQKIFGEHEKYSNFKSGHGVFYDIDYYKDDFNEDMSKEDIKKLALSNIDTLKETFEGFIDYFFNEQLDGAK